MKSRLRILAYFSHDHGRDVEIMLPLLYFAESVLNAEVSFGFLFDYDKMRRVKPNLVMVPNTIGSHEYFFIGRFAAEQGIPVFALDSEGNFRTDGSYDHWGYNIAKEYPQEYICCWSQRTRDYLRAQEPQLADRIVTTGATGFDRYQIYQPFDRQAFLTKRGIPETRYTHVITYAAWAFGKINFPVGKEALVRYFKGDASKLTLVEPERIRVRDILQALIEANPRVLFIMKVHPTEMRPTEVGQAVNEVWELTGDNVRVEGPDTSIDELIDISDLWLSFESTTAIEAWLRNKETILLRPSVEFNNSISEKHLDSSQPVARTTTEALRLVNEFISQGRLEDFHKATQIEERQQVIHESIGYADGLNHVRAGYYLKKVAEEKVARANIRYQLRWKSLTIYVLILLGRFFYHRGLYSKLPKAKKFLWVFEQYSLLRIKNTFAQRKPDFAAFYRKHRIHERIADGSLFKDILTTNAGSK